ncbi:MAG: PhnA domain-containing protein [Weeksellaceae bacterium]|nr:PhnA domain-containing protein [Weeksellaceae bacterium]
MSLNKILKDRSGGSCELCQSEENVGVYMLAEPDVPASEANALMLCAVCKDFLDGESEVDVLQWRFLADTIWSEHSAVKVASWRMLQRLRSDAWYEDLLNTMYLDEEEQELAGAQQSSSDTQVVHKDSNGVVLQAGDSVVLIKDLKVKGSSMVAKQGTAVRRISLDHANEKYIEGKVNGQTIVIVTDYVKKI